MSPMRRIIEAVADAALGWPVSLVMKRIAAQVLALRGRLAALLPLQRETTRRTR